MTATQDSPPPPDRSNPVAVKGPVRHRFYCPSLASLALTSASGDGCDQLIDLDPEQSHHARRVLKMAEGEAVELFDGQGSVGLGALDRGHAVCVDCVQRVPRPLPTVDVATAWPKGPRADSMISVLSQLGANRVIPLRTARSVVHPGESRRQRYEKLAIESAKQCRRSHLMRIAKVTELDAVMSGAAGVRLMAGPGSVGQTPSPAPPFDDAANVLILVGPEGGWSDHEKTLGLRLGFKPWVLGPHVMRIETAAAAAVAIVRYHAHQTQSAL